MKFLCSIIGIFFFLSCLSSVAYSHSTELHSWDSGDHNPNYTGNMSQNAMELCDNLWGSSWLSTTYKNEIHDGAWDEDKKGLLRSTNHGFNPITNSTGGLFTGTTALARSTTLWTDMDAAFGSGQYTGGDDVGAYHYLGRCCHLLQDMATYVHIHPQSIDPLEHSDYEDLELDTFKDTNWSSTLPLYLPTDSLNTIGKSIEKLDTFSAQRLTSKTFSNNVIESFIEQMARITYFRSTFWGEVVFVSDGYLETGPAAPEYTTQTDFGGTIVGSKPNILYTMFGEDNVKYINGWDGDDYFEITDQDGSSLTWENTFDDQWFPCAGGTQDGHYTSGGNPVNAGIRTTGRFHFATAYNVNPVKYPDGTSFADSSLGYYMCKYAIEVGLSYNAALIGVGSRKTQTISIQSSNPNSGISIEVSPSDYNGNANGATSFGRTYVYGTRVSLTAPSLVSGNSFSRWHKNGVQISTNNSIDIIIKGNDTLTAVYNTGSSQDEVTYKTYSTADSTVIEQFPTTNEGGQYYIWVGNDASFIAHGLVRFGNLSSILKTSTVTYAELKLYTGGYESGNVLLGKCNSSWTEYGVTWNTKPGYSTIVSYSNQSDGGSTWAWDSSEFAALKQQVQSWVDNPATNYGFYLASNTTNLIEFYTREYNSGSSCASLTVRYLPPPPPDLRITNLYPDIQPANGKYQVGQDIDWYVTVKNDSSAGYAPESSVGYYLGTTSDDLSNRINSDTTSELYAGGSEQDHDNYLFADSDIGIRYIICKADYKDDLTEVLENNNTYVYGPFEVYEPQVGDLSFEPIGGVYTDHVSVTLSCPDTPDAVIHYTTNGIDPTETDPVYTTPILISSTTDLRARAWKTNYTPSTFKSAVYTITGTISTPVVSPSGGVYGGPIDVSMTCSPMDAEIHYTTDGTNPTEGSNLYLGPMLIYRDTIINAKAFKTDWLSSSVASAEYTIYHDLDIDHQINFKDVSILAYYWHQTCEAASWCEGADCNRNRIVDLEDLALLCEKWLFARFELTASAIGGGTISPSAGSYERNEIVTVTAHPNPVYKVKRWIGTNNDASSSNTNTVTMTSDKTVTVEFVSVPGLKLRVNGQSSPPWFPLNDGETCQIEMYLEQGANCYRFDVAFVVQDTWGFSRLYWNLMDFNTSFEWGPYITTASPQYVGLQARQYSLPPVTGYRSLAYNLLLTADYFIFFKDFSLSLVVAGPTVINGVTIPVGTVLDEVEFREP